MPGRPSTRIAAVACAAAGLLAAAGSAAASPRSENPCLKEGSEDLRCPDLAMSRPYNLYQQITSGGRRLLRAANSLNSVGQGPVEVRGTRVTDTAMRVRQRIYRDDGSRLSIATTGRLGFKTIPGDARYWKFRDPAEFELWKLDGEGVRRTLVRGGPKIYYCLRDLQRTRPGLPGSPSRRVYPACSTNPDRTGVTLGTSVGWSDIYPSSYHEQWIDVTGLNRACYAYVHIADPKNGIHELNEDNNSAATTVRLPYNGDPGRCARFGSSGGKPPPDGGGY